MFTIYKYPLEIKDVQQVEIPIGSNILSVQMQGEKLYLWALVAPEAPKKAVTVKIYGTGQPVDYRNMCYIGSVQNGAFVWHVFMETQHPVPVFAPKL